MRTALAALLLTGCAAGELALTMRSAAGEQPVVWKASETAVIVCDMWDKHTCRNATRRVGEMAPQVDAFVKAARAEGALIVHAPSDVIAFYDGTPQRQRAKAAPAVTPPEPIKSRPLEPEREGALPIEDSDWCDDEPPCDLTPWTTRTPRAPWPWTRQIATIEIAPEDLVSQSGAEMYNVFKPRGIKNVILCGVHTNMCVLGRSFGIRQMVRLGFNVALARDLTDCLYNPRQKPHVSHDEGTRLMIGHIERHWCPSFESGDVTD